MPEYRIYRFSGRHIDQAETITAHDDDAAAREARSRVGGKTVELWRGTIRLQTFEPSEPPEASEASECP